MKLYHISRSKLIDKLIPRVPNAGKLQTNNLEDNKTPRICFGPDIKHCIRALDNIKKDDVFHVYYIETENYYKPTIDDVYDCELTNEYWILKPVKPKYLYDIKIVDNGTKIIGKPIYKPYKQFKKFKVEVSCVDYEYEIINKSEESLNFNILLADIF